MKTENNISASQWSKIAGKMLGNICAVWFAAALSAVVLVVPTKLIWWLITWFWNLF